MTRVIVSTDDEEIAQIAAMHGAEVPFRPPIKFAENLVVDVPVIQHALDVLRETEGYLPDDVVQLRPTSPLRPVGLIKRHFTLDRTWKGTDHAASLEPDGLRRLGRNLDQVTEALTYKDEEILLIEKPQRAKLKWKNRSAEIP